MSKIQAELCHKLKDIYWLLTQEKKGFLLGHVINV